MKDKRHILFLCAWYPNKNNPTLGNFVQKHAEAASLYNRISVIAIFSHESFNYEVVNTLENDVDTYIVYYPKVTFPLFGIKQLIQRRRRKKAFLMAYKQVVDSSGPPSLVHLNQVFPIGQFALYLKSKYNLPFVITENSTAYHMGTNKLPYWALKLALYYMSHASRILPVSKDLQSSLSKLGVITPMQIIPNVVNEQIFGNLSSIQPEKTQFIHISTANDQHKNISGMLRSIQRLSLKTTDFHFLIISDGKLDSFIKMAFDELKINKELLSFEGTKTTEEVAHAINKSSVFVLFSNYENLPCVILESLVIGKPVISTNVNGIPECLDESNGILIEPKNELQLEEAMLKMIEGTCKFNIEEIKKNALSRYSYQAVGKLFDGVYDEIINKYAL